MNQFKIFTEALQIQSPWLIKDIRFIEVYNNESVLCIDVEYDHKNKYQHPDGREYQIIDHEKVIKRYSNFLTHTCYVHINLPSFKKQDMSIEQAQLPITKKPPIFDF